MTDLASRPRMTPMAGRRKPTSTWCEPCGTLHRTHRAVGGPDPCPFETPAAHGHDPLPVHVQIGTKGPSPTNPFGPAFNPDKGRWV